MTTNWLTLLSVLLRDSTEMKIIVNGGKVAKPKHAQPGMAWQGTFMISGGNIFGIYQPDEMQNRSLIESIAQIQI